jgi:hypothetical protein
MRGTVRALLVWFSFFGLSAGAWQLFAPESFYRDFPGFGRHWVDVDGPFNEHLVRDVGQGSLAFGVVALVALLTGGVWLARATGLAALISNLPHHAYHQANLHVLPTASDQLWQTVTLSLVSVTALVLTVLAWLLPVERAQPAASPSPPARRAAAGPARRAR